MNSRTVSIYALLGVVASVAVVGAYRQSSVKATAVIPGAVASLGNGTVTSFVQFNRDKSPEAIGITFSAEALRALPTDRTDEHRCFDHNGNGAIEPLTECMPTHERVIPLPSNAARRADIPFKWVLLNWNPAGHAPAHVYGLPHFDIHYYIESIENTFALMPGPCGEEMIRCDQFERAVRPVPSNYVHPDFKNVDAAAPAMGNHLVDLTGGELHGKKRFDRTWIYGAYDGRITFWEEMVTREYLEGKPDGCHAIKTPAGVEVAGYYPTLTCYRYDTETGALSHTIEGFVYRQAALAVRAD